MHSLCLGIALLLPAGGTTDGGGSAPYVVKVTALDAAQSSTLTEALNSLDGVAAVAFDPAENAIHITTENEAFLNYAALHDTLEAKHLTVAEITEPAWARHEVYVAQSSGGA